MARRGAVRRVHSTRTQKKWWSAHRNANAGPRRRRSSAPRSSWTRGGGRRRGDLTVRSARRCARWWRSDAGGSGKSSRGRGPVARIVASGRGRWGRTTARRARRCWRGWRRIRRGETDGRALLLAWIAVGAWAESRRRRRVLTPVASNGVGGDRMFNSHVTKPRRGAFFKCSRGIREVVGVVYYRAAEAIDLLRLRPLVVQFLCSFFLALGGSSHPVARPHPLHAATDSIVRRGHPLIPPTERAPTSSSGSRPRFLSSRRSPHAGCRRRRRLHSKSVGSGRHLPLRLLLPAYALVLVDVTRAVARPDVPSRREGRRHAVDRRRGPVRAAVPRELAPVALPQRYSLPASRRRRCDPRRNRPSRAAAAEGPTRVNA